MPSSRESRVLNWGLALALGAGLLAAGVWWMWPSRGVDQMQRAEGTSSDSAQLKSKAPEVSAPRRVPELEATRASRRADSETRTAASTRFAMSADALPTTADEHEGGDLAQWYERWRKEPQDPRATSAAHGWLADQLESLGLTPQVFHLACGATLCRVGFAFERLRDLHALRHIQPPADVSVKTTLPYSYESSHMIIAYWARPDAE